MQPMRDRKLQSWKRWMRKRGFFYCCHLCGCHCPQIRSFCGLSPPFSLHMPRLSSYLQAALHSSGRYGRERGQLGRQIFGKPQVWLQLGNRTSWMVASACPPLAPTLPHLSKMYGSLLFEFLSPWILPESCRSHFWTVQYGSSRMANCCTRIFEAG